MFDKFFEKLNAFETFHRDGLIEVRKFMRHEDSQAEVMVAGRPYALHDWSMGGILFATPNNDWNMGGVYYDANPAPKLEVNDVLKLALRFHTLNETIEVPLEATVVRIGSRGTVAKFNNLPQNARRRLQRVLDLRNAEKFLQSQAPQVMAA